MESRLRSQIEGAAMEKSLQKSIGTAMAQTLNVSSQGLTITEQSNRLRVGSDSESLRTIDFYLLN